MYLELQERLDRETIEDFEEVSVSGAEFKTARKALAMTQVGVAERLGVTQKTVSFWERDKYPVPVSIELAMKQLKTEYIERLQGSGV